LHLWGHLPAFCKLTVRFFLAQLGLLNCLHELLLLGHQVLIVHHALDLRFQIVGNRVLHEPVVVVLLDVRFALIDRSVLVG